MKVGWNLIGKRKDDYINKDLIELLKSGEIPVP